MNRNINLNESDVHGPYYRGAEVIHCIRESSEIDHLRMCTLLVTYLYLCGIITAEQDYYFFTEIFHACNRLCNGDYLVAGDFFEMLCNEVNGQTRNTVFDSVFTMIELAYFIGKRNLRMKRLNEHWGDYVTSLIYDIIKEG